MSRAQLRREELASADRIWHLQQTPLIEGLSLSDVTAIASACMDRIYSKGEPIFNQGDPVDSLFILNRGCVRVSIVNGNDREKILGIFTTGGIFGDNMLGPQNYFQTQAMAHEECWVSIMARDQFLRMVQQRPSLALNYIRILSQRLLEAREDIEAQSFLDTEHRLGKTLLKLAETHGKPVFGEKDRVKLKISLSHEHLAQLVAANRPHVSTIMSKFKKRGWINYQGRKLLIQVEELKVLSEPREGSSDWLDSKGW